MALEGRVGESAARSRTLPLGAERWQGLSSVTRQCVRTRGTWHSLTMSRAVFGGVVWLHTTPSETGGARLGVGGAAHSISLA